MKTRSEGHTSFPAFAVIHLIVFRTGERVEHLQRPKWGYGVVKEILKNGKIRVWFIHVGEKVLVLDKAKLVPLRLTEGKASNVPPVDPIILKSKRSKRLEHEVCHECRERKPVVWRYSKSNRGPVNICSQCKGEVVTRSSGAIDAMDLVKSSGQFESNRRRH